MRYLETLDALTRGIAGCLGVLFVYGMVVKAALFWGVPGHVGEIVIGAVAIYGSLNMIGGVATQTYETWKDGE